MNKVINLALAFFCVGAWAQSPSPTSPVVQMPQLMRVKGQHTRLVWEDGREAELYASYGKPYTFNAPFAVTENTCSKSYDGLKTPKGYLALKCFLRTEVLVDAVAFRWTKNPVATKIGKIIYSQNFGTFRDVAFRAGILKYSEPELSRRFNSPQLTCGDYSWLPGGTVSIPPNLLKVAIWRTEAQSTNSETGVSEVRIRDNAFDLEFRKVQGGNLELASVGPFTDQPLLSPVALPGIMTTTIGLELKTSDINSCQIELAANGDAGYSAFYKSAFGNDQQEAQKTGEDGRTYEAYAYGASPLIDKIANRLVNYKILGQQQVVFE